MERFQRIFGINLSKRSNCYIFVLDDNYLNRLLRYYKLNEDELRQMLIERRINKNHIAEKDSLKDGKVKTISGIDLQIDFDKNQVADTLKILRQEDAPNGNILIFINGIVLDENDSLVKYEAIKEGPSVDGLQICRVCAKFVQQMNLTSFGKPLNYLGAGTFGTVLRYENAAIKFTVLQTQKGLRYFESIREVATLAALQDHPNIVTLLGSSMERRKITVEGFNIPNIGSSFYTDSAVALELAESDFWSKLKSKNDSEKFTQYLFDIANGLYWMHSHDIIHRDVKPQNVLIKDGHAKISDLGSAQSGPIKYSELNTFVTTLWWRAPEILIMHEVDKLENGRYGKEIDVWSFAMMLHETYFAFFEEFTKYIKGNDAETQLWKIVRAFHPKLSDEEKNNIAAAYGNQKYWTDLLNNKNPGSTLQRFEDRIKQKIDGTYWDLFSKCAEFDPKKRITMREVIEHPFFEKQREGRVVKIREKTPAEESNAIQCQNIDPTEWDRLFLYEDFYNYVEKSTAFLTIHILRCYYSFGDRSPNKFDLHCALALATNYLDDDAGQKYCAKFYNSPHREKFVKHEKSMFYTIGAKLHLPTSWVWLISRFELENRDVSQLELRKYAWEMWKIEISKVGLERTPEQIARYAVDGVW